MADRWSKHRLCTCINKIIEFTKKNSITITNKYLTAFEIRVLDSRLKKYIHLLIYTLNYYLFMKLKKINLKVK